MTTIEPGGTATPKPAPRPGPPRPGPRPGPTPSVHGAPVPASGDPHRFGRVDPDGTVWLISGAGERVIGSWQAGDTEAAFAHFGRRFDDLSTEVALMESRLASGTGDARKIKSAAAALAESLPTAAVLGDVDALAARLTTIVEHADTAAAGRQGQARGAPRRADRPQGGAGRRGRGPGGQLDAVEGRRRPAARDPRRVADHQRPRPQDRRRAVEALLGGPRDVQPPPRLAFRRARPRTRRRPAGQGGAVRARRGAGRLHRLGPDRRGVPRPADASGRRRAARPRTSTTRCGSGSRPPRTRSSPPATRRQRRTRRRVPRQRRGQGGAAGGGREARHLRSGRRAGRAAHHRRQVGRDRQGAPRAQRRPGAPAARGGEEGPRRPDAAGSTRRRKARADQFRARAEQFERQAEKAAAAGRTKDAEQARANAEQWRQWAEAAAEALGKKALGLLRPVCRCRRRGRRAGPCAGARRPPGGVPPRRPAAARCAPTPPAPSGRSARSPRSRRGSARSRAGMRLGRGLPRPHRQQPEKRRHRRAGQRDPRQRPAPGQQRQHREADTEHQRQPREHPRRQRDPVADRGVVADQHVPSPGAAGVRQHERQPAARTRRSRRPTPLRRGRSRVRRGVRRPRCRP